MGTLPAHTERVRTVECAELVALDVFQRAEQTGQLVTLGQVERRLAELLALPGQSCPRLAIWSVDGAPGWCARPRLRRRPFGASELTRT